MGKLLAWHTLCEGVQSSWNPHNLWDYHSSPQRHNHWFQVCGVQNLSFLAVTPLQYISPRFCPSPTVKSARFSHVLPPHAPSFSEPPTFCLPFSFLLTLCCPFQTLSAPFLPSLVYSIYYPHILSGAKNEHPRGMINTPIMYWYLKEEGIGWYREFPPTYHHCKRATLHTDQLPSKASPWYQGKYPDHS